MAGRTKRSKVRFSIATKLIAAAAVLTTVIVSGFVAATLVSTERMFKEAAARLTRSETEALGIRGLAATQNIADTTSAPLLEGDIGRVVDTLESVARGDKEILDAAVVRTDWRVVARAGAGKLGEAMPAFVKDKLAPLKKASQLPCAGAKAPACVEGQSLSGKKVVAFGSPIQLSGRVMGYMYLEMSTERIDKVVAEIERDRKRAVSRAMVRIVGLGAAALVFGILVAVFQGLRFGGSIRHLAQVAAAVGNGNLSIRAKRTTNDEIGVLCDRFNEMTGRIEVLLRESAEKAALDKELDRAKSIQTLLMPPRGQVDTAGLSYCGWCEPASQVGGDWWHHYPLGADRVLLCVGDVTGHGIPSAILTASTKASCDTVLADAKDVDLPSFMRTLSRVIREAGKGELTMTFLAVIVDWKNMTIEVANAGHNFPFICREGSIKSLVARGPRLGDGVEFTAIKGEIKPGDVLVMYSDGLIECESPDGYEYGQRTLTNLVRKHSKEPAEVLRDHLVEDAFRFFGSAPRKDDITLVVCRVGVPATQPVPRVAVAKALA